MLDKEGFEARGGSVAGWDCGCIIRVDGALSAVREAKHPRYVPNQEGLIPGDFANASGWISRIRRMSCNRLCRQFRT